MLNKSDKYFNIGSMILNDNEQYHTASVHCFYYSVLQYMKYLLNSIKTEDKPISYSEQETNSGESSHEYIFNEIFNRINCNGPANLKKLKTLKEDIRLLKKARVEADYKQTTYSQEDCLNYKGLAENSKKALKYFYNDKL